MTDRTQKLSSDRATLCLLATSDLHAHILAYDYFADCARPTLGLARTAQLIDAARAEFDNTLLFDNGDFLNGSPLADYAVETWKAGGQDAHPVIAAMNLVGYDAATLGNHEFNFGLPFLKNALAQATFPIVSSNCFHAGPERAPYVQPRIIIEKKITLRSGQTRNLRIGVLGCLPPQTVDWDRQQINNAIEIGGIEQEARSAVAALRADGVDLIVALSHSGIAPSTETSDGENVTLALAGIDGIDAIIAGHTHFAFPGPELAASEGIDPIKGTLWGKPAIKPGSWGSHLGKIQLELGFDEAGTCRVISHVCRIEEIAQRASDGTASALVDDHPGVLDLSSPAHAATLNHMSRPVGRCARPMQSYFSLLTGDLSLTTIASAQANFLRSELKGGPLADLPLLSAVAPCKTGGRGGPDFYTDVPSGSLTLRSLADLYLFPNSLFAVSVSGADLHDWLEQSAAVFNQLDPNHPDQILINPAAACYNFDVLYGLSYEIDLSQPARYSPDGILLDPKACRISDIRHKGAPIQSDQNFVVATNNYRASGGGGFCALNIDKIVLETQKSSRDLLASYFATDPDLEHDLPEVFRFKPLAGTSAIFETGPKARNHLAACTVGNPVDIGNSNTGFAQFRLTF